MERAFQERHVTEHLQISARRWVPLETAAPARDKHEREVRPFLLPFDPFGQCVQGEPAMASSVTSANPAPAASRRPACRSRPHFGPNVRLAKHRGRDDRASRP